MAALYADQRLLYLRNRLIQSKQILHSHQLKLEEVKRQREEEVKNLDLARKQYAALKENVQLPVTAVSMLQSLLYVTN